MTHGVASLPAVFIVAAAAAVPLCGCWVYQEPLRWVGPPGSPRLRPLACRYPASHALLHWLSWTILSGETPTDANGA